MAVYPAQMDLYLIILAKDNCYNRFLYESTPQQKPPLHSGTAPTTMYHWQTRGRRRRQRPHIQIRLPFKRLCMRSMGQYESNFSWRLLWGIYHGALRVFSNFALGAKSVFGSHISAPSMKLENLLGASQWIRHRGLYAKFEQNQPTRLACGGCYRFGRCTSYIMGTSVIHLLFGLLGLTYGCVSGLFLRISFNFTSFSCGEVALWVCSSIRWSAAFCLTRNKLMPCIRPCF